MHLWALAIWPLRCNHLLIFLHSGKFRSSFYWNVKGRTGRFERDSNIRCPATASKQEPLNGTNNLISDWFIIEKLFRFTFNSTDAFHSVSYFDVVVAEIHERSRWIVVLGRFVNFRVAVRPFEERLSFPSGQFPVDFEILFEKGERDENVGILSAAVNFVESVDRTVNFFVAL